MRDKFGICKLWISLDAEPANNAYSANQVHMGVYTLSLEPCGGGMARAVSSFSPDRASLAVLVACAETSENTRLVPFDRLNLRGADMCPELFRVR
jgi:hypothetical protein